jgi:hypothetical protein
MQRNNFIKDYHIRPFVKSKKRFFIKREGRCCNAQKNASPAVCLAGPAFFRSRDILNVPFSSDFSHHSFKIVLRMG